MGGWVGAGRHACRTVQRCAWMQVALLKPPHTMQKRAVLSQAVCPCALAAGLFTRPRHDYSAVQRHRHRQGRAQLRKLLRDALQTGSAEGGGSTAGRSRVAL